MMVAERDVLVSEKLLQGNLSYANTFKSADGDFCRNLTLLGMAIRKPDY